MTRMNRELPRVQPSLTGLFRLRMFSQDYVLGYFQPSLRDWVMQDRIPEERPISNEQ
jgi:hypothetical protein